MGNFFSSSSLKELLTQSFDAMVSVSKPDGALPSYIEELAAPRGKAYVIGAGKASAQMAKIFEETYPFEIARGVVVTRYGFEAPTKKIEILQAAHPVSDKAGVHAVNEILALLSQVKSGDVVYCLLSGGGSALLTAPVDELSFEQVQEIGKALVLSGADIAQINTVRKHLNKALGGGLAAAMPTGAKLITYAISDVAHNNPSVIASGSTVGDETTLADCLEILQRHKIETPEAVQKALRNPYNETPFPDDMMFKGQEYHLIATPDIGLEKAREFCLEQGFDVEVIDAHLGGDTNAQAKIHAQMAIDKAKELRAANASKGFVYLSGGETTVKVTGSGLGGPNTQFMLQAAIALNGHAQVFALCGDSDGIDGAGDNAGALIYPESLARAKEQGLEPQRFLDNNDAYNFFKPLGDLLITGPTQTNVNDYRAFVILP